MKYEHLLGKPFVFGKQDCYTIVREFYLDNYNIELPDFARPNQFWDHGLNLYIDNVEYCGFEFVDERPVRYLPGDISLAAIQSKVANHAMIHLGDGNILHHFIGRLSEVTLYKSLWRNNTVATIRHTSLKDSVNHEQSIDFRTLARPVFGS